MTVQPNSLVGVLGDHGDFPIEEMVLRWGDQPVDDGAGGVATGAQLPSLVASASHDDKVKFWDLSELLGDGSDDDDSDESDITDSDSDSSESDVSHLRNKHSKKRSRTDPVVEKRKKALKPVPRPTSVVKDSSAGDFFDGL